MMIQGLGDQWQFTEIWVKKYPCCLYTHRYIDGLLELKQQAHFSAQDVHSIRLHVAAGAMEVCNRPSPLTTGDLQFSFQHVLSSALLDDDVNYHHIDVARVVDPTYVNERQKVEVVVRRDWTSRLPVESPSLLEVQLHDGRTLTNSRQYPTGTVHEPLSLDFVKGLFDKFVGENLFHHDREFAANAIAELESLDAADVSQLIRVLNHDD